MRSVPRNLVRLTITILLMVLVLSCKLIDPHDFDNPGDPGDPTAQTIRSSLVTLGAIGLSACIMKGETVVWQGQFGKADVESGRYIDPDGLFRVASISKSITAVAIMKLMEDGKLGLDDDAGRYLPFPLRNPHFPDTPITIHHLLAHAGSICRQSDELYEKYGQTPEKILPLGELCDQYFNPQRNPDWKSLYLQSAPGKAAMYSNWGTTLLGLVIETASGQLFEDYVKSTILDPLGMDSSAWFTPEIDSARLVKHYGPDRLPYKDWHFVWYPAASFLTSPRDFQRFMAIFTNQGNSNGVRLLRAETIKAMSTIPFPQAGMSIQFALGLETDPMLGNLPLIGKSGDYAPGYRSRFLYDPNRDIGFFIMVAGAFDRPHAFAEIETALWQKALEYTK
jgi:CubicO group peptidase (beta-lactamase class C family)